MPTSHPAPPGILFADPRFVVLNKPAGLPAHPGPRGGASVEDCFPALSRRRDGPWLAHRLDADTAGCLLVALRKTALVEAQACFASRRVEKRYWAVVAGGPPGTGGRISRPLRRHSDRNGWRMVADPATGDPADTEWRLLGGAADGNGKRISWLELVLRTGRTHQARVHCALLGCPILGDPVYGEPGGQHGTLQLLARFLRLPLDPPVAAIAPPPPHMLAALRRCGLGTAADASAAPSAHGT